VALLALVLLHVIPQPARAERLSCHTAAFALRSVSPAFDRAALAELNERWSALGLGRLRVGGALRIVVHRVSFLPPQAYRMRIDDRPALALPSFDEILHP
jgi:hypothetical protein